MQQKSSIGIIGLGWVGSRVAIAMMRNGLARELLVRHKAPFRER